MHEFHHRAVHADRQSLAAGRDLNLTITLNEYRELLAHRTNDPHALTCQWCGLGGQAPDLDECIACGHDIGAERRAREAKQARELRVRRAMGDIRHVVCYLSGMLMVTAFLSWYHHTQDSVASLIISFVVLSVVAGELLVYAWIGVEVWLVCDLPRLMRRHGLGWLVGE